MENQSERVKILLEKTKGFMITSKPYNVSTKHQNKPNFCLSKFSNVNKLEAISCDHPYFMDELRLIRDEIILALTPDSLDLFLHILWTNGINHLRIKIIGISTSNLNTFQEIFPSMSLNSLEDGKRFTHRMVEEVSMAIQKLTERYQSNSLIYQCVEFLSYLFFHHSQSFDLRLLRYRIRYRILI